MPRYIAFLRAINVGGHVVKMQTLQAHFSALGFADVETFIASGNLVFRSRSSDAAALEVKIAASLHKSLGYAVQTFLRTDAELASIARHPSFPAAEIATAGYVMHIGFISSKLHAEARQKLLGQQSEYDKFHVHDREIYWLCRGRSSDSKYSGGLLEKILGVPATFRNVNTVHKLVAKYSA
ncbi:hypothetical protein AYO41_03130 [Verrucomicrobia bacterium SCGC AG-212-E04]|nr:hypothetical protein AYO41_03130 [Verrucomicrobia bacterium SCGC AG-212-E04]